MKYIVVRGIVDTPILFSEYATHLEIAAGRDVVSAGFCSIETYIDEFDDIKARCQVYGKSDSLNVDSREQNVKLIENMFKRGL